MLARLTEDRQGACQTRSDTLVCRSVKQDETRISVRIPNDLKDALERERQRMNRKAGVELNLSVVIRALVKEAMQRRSKRRAAA